MAAKAAAKLNMEKQKIFDSLKATMIFFIECARLKIFSAIEIEAQLKENFSLSPKFLTAFFPIFVENRKILEKISEQNSTQILPNFRDLKWRLEVAAAQRSCQNLAEPRLLLKFETSAEEKFQFFSCDGATLRHVTAELESALAELRSPEFRKLTRRL